MSELQKESVMGFTSGRVFNAIQPVYSALPDRFTTNQVMAKARLSGHGTMCAVISVLERSFRCSRTAAGIWKKPL